MLQSPRQSNIIYPDSDGKLRFELQPGTLVLYRPDGGRFLTFVELRQIKAQTEERLAQAEQQLEQERQHADRLAERLGALGTDPEAEE